MSIKIVFLSIQQHIMQHPPQKIKNKEAPRISVYIDLQEVLLINQKKS